MVIFFSGTRTAEKFGDIIRPVSAGTRRYTLFLRAAGGSMGRSCHAVRPTATTNRCPFFMHSNQLVTPRTAPSVPLQVPVLTTEPEALLENTTQTAAPDAVAAAQVLRQFRQVFSAVRHHFHQLEKLAGVGGAQVWALSEIRQSPGLSMNGLARAMDVHQSTASNLVRQLVQRGLVRTEKSSVDRRGVCLFLEAAAETLLHSLPGPHQGLLPQALSRLSPLALHQLSQGLGALVGKLSVDEAAARTPLADL